jgi:hypothetical protein
VAEGCENWGPTVCYGPMHGWAIYIRFGCDMGVGGAVWVKCAAFSREGLGCVFGSFPMIYYFGTE